MNRVEGLVRSLAVVGLVILPVGCRPSVSESEKEAVTDAVSQNEPPLNIKPFDPLTRLMAARSIVYNTFIVPNSLLFMDDEGDEYQFSPPPYLEEMNVIMWTNRSTCGLPTQEGNEIYAALLRNYQKGERVDKNIVRAAIGQVVDCKPIMENRWQRRHPQKQ